MKILYWLELFWPYIGGIEVFSMQLINALQKRGYEFFVITSQGGIQELPAEENYNGIQIYRFLFRSAIENRNIKEILAISQSLTKLKNAIKPDLVHLNSTGTSLYFYDRIAIASTTPVLFTSHSTFRFTSDNNTLLGRTLLSASWVNAVSNAMLTDLRFSIPEITNYSSLIYNSLQFPALEILPPPVDSPIILCISRLVPEKGIDIAIDAFALLIRQFPNARLFIAGDGYIKNSLEQKVTTLNLNQAIRFLGWIDPEQIPDLINSATMVVVPSRYNEPFGLVALQAAQMARPVIATRCGGLKEVVVDQQTGLLIDKDDVESLAKAMAFLLKNPAIAIKFGHAARQRALDMFAWEHFVDAYEALYIKLGQRKEI